MNQHFILSMMKLYSIAWLYHILFIHSSVDGHLGYFTFLPFVSLFSFHESPYFTLHFSKWFSCFPACPPVYFLPREGKVVSVLYSKLYPWSLTQYLAYNYLLSLPSCFPACPPVYFLTREGKVVSVLYSKLHPWSLTQYLAYNYLLNILMYGSVYKY